MTPPLNTLSTLEPARRCTCPLCGGPNDCAPAEVGTFATACWCAKVTFRPALLARVPEADRNACICAGCVAVFEAEVGGDKADR